MKRLAETVFQSKILYHAKIIVQTKKHVPVRIGESSVQIQMTIVQNRKIDRMPNIWGEQLFNIIPDSYL